MEGRALSKTQSFRCFQSIQGMSRAAEASPLRSGFGLSRLAASHQSCSEASVDGALQVILSL
jgi:hypothetical protein